MKNKTQILALILNLTTTDYLILKKNSTFQFIKKKIIFNNIKLYGNYILLNRYIKMNKLIPLAHIMNKRYLSHHKNIQVNNTKPFLIPAQLFIKNI